MESLTSQFEEEHRLKMLASKHPWGTVETEATAIKLENAAKLKELETRQTLLADLDAGLVAAKKILEHDRGDSQQSEDYLATIEDAPKMEIPEFVLTKEQEARLKGYGGFDNFISSASPPEPKQGFWKTFLHTSPKAWKKPFAHVVARLAPVISMAASTALAIVGITTAPVVIPAAIALLGASGFVSVVQHKDAKTRSSAARDAETIKLGKIASKGYFDRSSSEQRWLWDTTYADAAATRMRHPFLSSRWAELHPDAICPVRELEEKRCILRYQQLQARTADGQLEEVNKNIEIRRDELDFARQSVLGFDAWKHLAGWEVSDDVGARVNRTRELRAEYRARGALQIAETDPESRIDLDEIEVVNTPNAELDSIDKPILCTTVAENTKLSNTAGEGIEIQ